MGSMQLFGHKYGADMFTYFFVADSIAFWITVFLGKVVQLYIPVVSILWICVACTTVMIVILALMPKRCDWSHCYNSVAGGDKDDHSYEI